MTDLVERLADSLGRDRALEVMLVAHLAIDRTCLLGRARPRVSAPARLLVDYMRATPAGIPFCAEDVAAYYALRPDAQLAPVLELALEAEQLTIADLSFLSRETVLSCLGATVKLKKKRTAADIHLEMVEGSAA